MAINQNRILTGSSGNVWLNGKLLAQVKKVEAKITGNFEDVNVVGSFATYAAYTGWAGSGTLTLQKIDSTVLNLLADAFKSGVMPEIKIVTKLKDQSTGQSERAAISNLVFTEFDLVNFENKALAEEEVPFKFADYDVLEKIA